MDKAVMVSVLVILVLLSGCAYQAAGPLREDASSGQDTGVPADEGPAEEPEEEVVVDAPVQDEPEEKEHVTVETDDGKDVTFEKLPDYEREKDTEEICDMDYPIECAEFFAVDGIEYITLKNAGYGSKIDHVVLRLNGEECDPVDSYIEPGQIKEFECYADAEGDGYVRGDFEMEYYAPIGQMDHLKTGSLVVMME